jgi:hypothetical protein
MKVFTRIIAIFAVLILITAPVYAATGVPMTGNHTGALVVFFALVAGMALSADTPRDYELGEYNDLPVAETVTIYEGSAVGDNGSGYMRALTAGDPFRGFAERKADNSGGSNGDINFRVLQEGRIVATFSSIAITNVGDDVYMSDDGTYTLTPGSNSRIGILIRYISATSGVVAFGVRETQTVGTSELAADCITGAKIADDAVDSEHIADGAIDLAHMSANSIDSDQYVDGSIDLAHLSADCVDGTKIADDAVSVEHLDDGILPSHVVKFAGTHTSTADAGGVNAVTVTGVAATDIVIATLKAAGSTPRTLTMVAATENTLTFTFNDDPSTDHEVYYVVLRAAS